MNEKIFDLSNKLNESLRNNPKVIELNRLEEELNNSYEVYLLSQKKDECLENYNNLNGLYSDGNLEVRNALLKLKEAKEKLNNHPLVKSYLSIYNEVKYLYMEIDNILFSDFKGRGC